MLYLVGTICRSAGRALVWEIFIEHPELAARKSLLRVMRGLSPTWSFLMLLLHLCQTAPHAVLLPHTWWAVCVGMQFFIIQYLGGRECQVIIWSVMAWVWWFSSFNGDISFHHFHMQIHWYSLWGDRLPRPSGQFGLSSYPWVVIQIAARHFGSGARFTYRHQLSSLKSSLS